MTAIASISYRLLVGIDVAAKSFTASWTTDCRDYVRSVKFDYSASGISQLQPHSKPLACFLPRP
jgi:hypothetical protein